MLAKRVAELVVMLLALATLLFFMLRATGDPIAALAGEDADPEMLARLRALHGMDQGLGQQYVHYLGQLLKGDFGRSLTSGGSAIDAVLQAFPATFLLAALAMTFTIVIALPIGAWLGWAPERGGRRIVAAIIYILQGTPGFVAALVLVQIFAIRTNWLPALGFAGPETWLLPTLSLSLFLAPKLARVLAVNVTEGLRHDYVRTARAAGASDRNLLWRQLLPNALLGAVALMGAQFAQLVGGAVVIEAIFAWPGLGRLLVQSTLSLDFPVIQATALTVAVLVFVANAATDLLFLLLDPRLRTGGGH